MEFDNRVWLPLLLTTCLVAMAHTQMDENYVHRVGTILQHPYLFTEFDDEANETVYKGFIKDIMEEGLRSIALKYEFVVRQDSEFGHKTSTSNSSWGGLIGDLVGVDKTVDIVAAPLTETVDRLNAVSFTTWFQSFGYAVVMKRFPKKLGYESVTLGTRLNRLFEPLSNSVWLLSIVAWLLTSITLYFISYVNPYDWRRMCRDREATMREGESFTCLNSFWFTLSAIFWQGYLRCPRSIGARIVVMSWWLYSLIFVAMYIASLTNFLQSGPIKEVIVDELDGVRINGIADFGNQDRFTYGVLGKGSTEAFFRQSSKREYKRIRHNMVTVPSIEAGIKRVRSSTAKKPFALIMESAMAKYFVNQEPCDIYMIRDDSFSGSYSFAYRFDNVTLGAILDSHILQLRESGELQHLEDIWFRENVCPDYPRPDPTDSQLTVPPFHKVDLASFSGALILIVIGLVCGSIVTGLEICIYKYAETGDRERRPEKRQMNDQGPFLKDSSLHRDDAEPMTDV